MVAKKVSTMKPVINRSAPSLMHHESLSPALLSPALLSSARLSPASLVTPFRDLPGTALFGRVVRVAGLVVEVTDTLGALSVGARIEIETATGPLAGEVVGLGDGVAQCLPFGALAGVKRGARVAFMAHESVICPDDRWLGRVIDGLARPLDGKGPLSLGRHAVSLRAPAPPAATRARLGGRFQFGVRALDLFTPAQAGQRLGIFSAAGVGKSALLSMIAQNAACDVIVAALIGERGREVRAFLEDGLGPERAAKTIAVVATADEPALMRREAAFTAMAIADYFRDQGRHVLCLMDSLTRIALAQREIGLAAGEPPTTRGFTPSVFAVLPALLERAGPASASPPGGGGSFIPGGATTGIFSVLVEGDDHDEPIADAARSILDGHIVLSREIAERGRCPAVDLLRSLSRTADAVLARAERAQIAEARRHVATYDDMREMIRIGAYVPGTNPAVDQAIQFHRLLEDFLNQEPSDYADTGETMSGLAERLSALQGT